MASVQTLQSSLEFYRLADRFVVDVGTYFTELKRFFPRQFVDISKDFRFCSQRNLQMT